MGYDTIGYEISSTNTGMGIGMIIWLVIVLICALVGGILTYFMFVKKDDKLKDKRLEWLRSFLRFDKMLIEIILKIAYIFAAIFITLFPLSFISFGFGGFIMGLLTIIFGNLIVRLIYEGILIQIMIWKNTTEIKGKLK